MSETAENVHINYIKSHLLPEILAKLPNETFDSYEIDESTGLNGFMSALYTIRLKTRQNESIKERMLISKFMRGDAEFRKNSSSYTQFANEIYIYNTVLPAFEKVLKASNVTTVSVEDWVAPTYAAKHGYVEGLSEHKDAIEAVLALEHLKPLGYTLGPRLCLNDDHLRSMCKPIGEYHALSYVLRLSDNERLKQLVDGIVPLSFTSPNDAEDDKYNLYRLLYRVAFDRFFEFFNRKLKENYFDAADADYNLVESVKRLEQQYFKNPVDLLEKIRTNALKDESDARFAVILHGDYNRNNVLFRYQNAQLPSGQSDELPKVESVKMIDFQEMRYSSPALDLSFFLFFNSTAEQRTIENWMQLLQTYHGHMFGTLSSVLKGLAKTQEQLELVEQQLKDYSFDNFNWHFSRYAFYGVMICMHFLPWMLSSEEDCACLAELWETDMHGPEFYKVSMKAGGEAVNFKILDAVRHACDMGYLNFVLTH